MKKYFNSLFVILLILFNLCCLQNNIVFAEENVNISIYYEKVEEVIDLSKTNIENMDFGDDYYLKYSKTDGYAYKMKRTKVSTEQELLDAMGGKSEFFLKYGQKCLLEAFRAATSDELKSRAGASYKPEVEIDLIDTSNDGKLFGNGYDTKSRDSKPSMREDFWPCSNGSKSLIQISDVSNKYRQFSSPSGKTDSFSTVFHEYAHFMDNTKIYDSEAYGSRYGLDGVHYINEVTNNRMAFIEGWAEYNEMIENKKVAKSYKNATKNLIIESETEKGEYTKVKSKDCDFNTLVKAESFNAYLLYRLSQEIGQDKITEAFIDSRWNHDRDMNIFVSRLVSLYPEDTETICKVVDEVFLNKASKDEFYKMVGKTEATQAYVANRTQATKKSNPIADFFASLTNKSSDSKNTTNSNSVNSDSEENSVNTKAISEDSSEFKDKLSSFINNIKTKLSKNVEKLKTILDDLFDKIKAFFTKDQEKEVVETEEESVGRVIKTDENSNDAEETSSEELQIKSSGTNPFN